MPLLQFVPRFGRRAALVCGLVAAVLTGAESTLAAPLFTEIADAPAFGSAFPASSRFFTMELAEMQATLAPAPLESFVSPVPGLTLTLPLPDGTSERFEIWESSVMHPELAAQFPEIKTYYGRGLDDRSATARLDTTPHGFHALILSLRPPMFIDPVERGNTYVYASHFKRSAGDGAFSEPFACDMVPTPQAEREMEDLMRGYDAQTVTAVTGPNLRTYRIAIGATREYTTFHGGTVALGLAAVTTSLNRVTGVYEREATVRMQLVANNNLIIYTVEPDPYTNNNGGTMLGQNQTNLDAVIGNANYDIGHVFSTGGGGIAGLGVVCRTGFKAQGVTGLNAPIGDNFDIDYVAHEMGHQYGGAHSFNGNAGACNGNRSGPSAYEPGSGTTIMSYAGICGSQNIANHSHADFHGRTFDQVVAYTTTGFGNGCPVVTATGNNAPAAVAGNVGLTIPISTPFLLSGVGTDVDGNVLAYSWEEFDLGPAGDPNLPVGNAPIFRSFPPVDRVWRSFPRKADIRNNTQTIGEILPSYARNLTFRFTVRDNLGGVSNNSTTLAVTDLAGPFLVTSIDATPWDPATSKTIAWNVAGTDVAPVSAPLVNILLSTDDGVTFPITLVAATPNDGSEVIVVPPNPTLLARVQVEGVGNVFFDWNNTAFEITAGAVGVGDIAAIATGPALEVHPNPFTNRASVSFALPHPGSVKLKVYDAAGRLVTTLFNGTQDAGRHTVEWNGRDANGGVSAAGVYFVRMETSGETRTVRSLLLK